MSGTVPSAEARLEAARGIMDRYAEWTGIGAANTAPRRYLWTDAFAVCNYLGLHEAGGGDRYLDLARALVDQVHRVLGRHRADGGRSGWLSGLAESEGAAHPTAGGLRIGKPLPDRAPGEPYDAAREWDRDGQYYHYLTKWMHALDRLWRVSDETRYHVWAVELAEAAHRSFAVRDGDDEGGAATRLYWKVSVDGSRPLLPSSGHHDPLDGLLTISALVGGAPEASSVGERLEPMLTDLERMCDGRSWATQDPLGAGGLLVDSLRARLDPSRRVRAVEADVAHDAGASLDAAARLGSWTDVASRRIAFRELGLSLGIHAAERALDDSARQSATQEDRSSGSAAKRARLVGALERHRALASAIEAFWLEPSNRSAATWRDHQEISAVMLATSLAPGGFLGV